MLFKVLRRKTPAAMVEAAGAIFGDKCLNSLYLRGPCAHDEVQYERDYCEYEQQVN